MTEEPLQLWDVKVSLMHTWHSQEEEVIQVEARSQEEAVDLARAEAHDLDPDNWDAELHETEVEVRDVACVGPAPEKPYRCEQTPDMFLINKEGKDDEKTR